MVPLNSRLAGITEVNRNFTAALNGTKENGFKIPTSGINVWTRILDIVESTLIDNQFEFDENNSDDRYMVDFNSENITEKNICSDAEVVKQIYQIANKSATNENLMIAR